MNTACTMIFGAIPGRCGITLCQPLFLILQMLLSSLHTPKGHVPASKQKLFGSVGIKSQGLHLHLQEQTSLNICL